jgi:hypothetical protein
MKKLLKQKTFIGGVLAIGVGLFLLIQGIDKELGIVLLIGGFGSMGIGVNKSRRPF